MEQTHGTSKSGAKSPQAGRTKAVTRVSSKSKKILDLQRSAGNRAVSGAVMATRQPQLEVQRQPELTLQRLSWEEFVETAFPGGDHEAAVKAWADKMAGKGGGGGGGGDSGVAEPKLTKTGTPTTSYASSTTGNSLSKPAQKLQIKRDILAKKAKGEKLTDDEITLLDNTEGLSEADRNLLDAEEKRVKEAKASEAYLAKQKADAEKAAKQTQAEAEDAERTRLSSNMPGKGSRVGSSLSGWKSRFIPGEEKAGLKDRKKKLAEALKGRKF